MSQIVYCIEEEGMTLKHPYTINIYEAEGSTKRAVYWRDDEVEVTCMDPKSIYKTKVSAKIQAELIRQKFIAKYGTQVKTKIKLIKADI